MRGEFFHDDYDEDYERELDRRESEAKERFLRRYMDDWGEDYERELQRAEREAEENDEEFDEENGLDGNSRRGHDDESDAEGTVDPCSESQRESGEHPEDPWAEEDHFQRGRKGGESSSSRGLHEAEQAYGDFSEYAAPSPEDSMGLIAPRLTAFDDEEREPMFQKPLSEDEKRKKSIEEVERFVSDIESDEDDWRDHDSGAEPRIEDYSDRILTKAEQMSDDYFDGDTEEQHYARNREDQHYMGSSHYEIHSLHCELRNKLAFYEERGDEENIRFVYPAAKAVERAHYLYSDKCRKDKQLQEMHEDGELTDIQYEENSVALEHRLRKQLTANQYSAISGGSSVGEEIGEVMGRQNNLLDDVHSPNEEQIQHVRDWVGQVPREVAEKYIDDAVSAGHLNKEQANHLMLMAARPTYSTNGNSVQKKERLAVKARRFFGF